MVRVLLISARTMKSHRYIIFLFQFVFANVSAQGSGNGIYLTAADFSNGKLTHVSKHTRVKPHDLFNKNVVEVKCNDGVFTYNKLSVFGYADKNVTYRFVANERLPIINPNEKILLYKKVSGSGLKNSPLVETFYFSKDAGSAVEHLTLRNLLASFTDNPAFTELVELCFTRDSDLTGYDAIHHTYRINRLLEIACRKTEKAIQP